MDELKKLLENAGVREADYRYPDEHYKGLADDALHVAFEDVYLQIRETDAKKAEELLQAMNKVWIVLESEWKDPTRSSPETFTTDDGREEPVSGRMSDDENYGVGGLIDQGR